MTDTATYHKTIVAATLAGEEHGTSAASWYFDGNTEHETYEAVLRGIEDGDPEVMDSFPSSPLSGEWAGDPTPRSVLEDLGVDEDDPAADEYLNAYEDAFHTAVYAEIGRVARLQVGTPAVELDMDARYSVGDGIAWQVVGYRGSDQVRAVMVGDDSVHVLDVSALTVLGEGDYCPGCGQIGCTAYGTEGS